MGQVPVFILSEEHWGEEFRATRIGVYGSKELATAAAAEILRNQDIGAIGSENYSFLIEEDVLISGRNLTTDELIRESGKSWRWWPQMCEKFGELEESV